MVKTGLDIVDRNWPKALQKKRVGLLCNPASVNGAYVHAAEIFTRLKNCRLTCFFGPQHGIRGGDQANMVEWEGFTDEKTGLPVYSLYGEHRKPTSLMLENIDGVVVDLCDVGARYYTYIWSVDLCLMACKELNKSMVVLDRPNPINGRDVEGPVLNEKFYSFVGLRKLPIRHGMTIGEIARYLKGEYHQEADLHIVPMQGYRRAMFFEDTGLPWIMPSPNIPTTDTALVYPGMCLLEGTNVSEGRGTTRPFELFGAPFIQPDTLVECLSRFGLPGVVFRPAYFKPTFSKFKDKLCGGAQVHVVNPKIVRPFYTGLCIIRTLLDLYPKAFEWSTGSYEYERRKKPIDILFGTDRIRLLLEQGENPKKIEKWYNKELEEFKKIRRKYLLYS